MQIKPGIGSDQVTFGMTREEVSTLLGEPDKKRQSGLDEDETEAWDYPSLGIYIGFDASLDWKLCTLEVDANRAQFGDQMGLNMTLIELQEWLNQRRVQFSQDSDDCVSVDDWDMNIWLEEGVVSEIQWWVPLGEDDQEIWPTL